MGSEMCIRDRYQLFKQFRGFDDYLSWRCDGHVQLQKHYLVDQQGRQIVKFIGRMENLTQDFKTICDTVGLDSLKLPHLNQSVDPSKRKQYQTFYNSDTQAMLTEAFRADIDFLGYEF